MTPPKQRSKKMKLGRRSYIGEFAEPSVRWVDGCECPICGCEDLMDAFGMALCVKCNKFVKPKRKR
jgi:hypothetical protein